MVCGVFRKVGSLTNNVSEKYENYKSAHETLLYHYYLFEWIWISFKYKIVEKNVLSFNFILF